MTEVVFLEVRLDPDIVCCDEGHLRVTGPGETADIQLNASNDAGFRRIYH
jgi:hypothetical protein